MVSSVLIDGNEELVRLSREFVFMKFCETDDKDEYYRAAAYFLPQWYWQPILAITDSEGREINPKWRRTHESIPAEELAKVLETALLAAGRGMPAGEASRLRGLLGRAEEELFSGGYDAAIRLCSDVRGRCASGRIRDDAGRIEHEARFLASIRDRIDGINAAGVLPEGFDRLLCALYFCTGRDYGEAWKVFRELCAGGGPAGFAAADVEGDLRQVVADCLGVSRVSIRRWRFGPDLFHEIRAEVRSRLDRVEGLGLRFRAELRNGTVFEGRMGFGNVSRGDALRASAFVPFLEAEAGGGISDAHVELLIDGSLLHENGMDGGASAGRPRTADARPMCMDRDVQAWWGSPGFEPVEWAGTAMPPAAEDRRHEEIREAYRDLDARRYYFLSTRAKYRLASLGSRALGLYVPLASRDGGVTALDMLWILARIPDKRAAAAVLHGFGADDLTLRHPGAVFYYLDWLDGQEYAPGGEIIGYLDGGDPALARLSARALGRIGSKDALMPLFERYKRLEPDSPEAQEAACAISSIAGRDFGLSPGIPPAARAAAMDGLAGWWKTFGEGNPRILWMARSVEEAGFSPAGELSRAIASGDPDRAAPILARAISEGPALARRCAIIAAKQGGCRGAGPAILDFLCRTDRLDPDVALARNALRDLMTKELLKALVARLATPGKGVVILDLLLVSTGNWGFYPPEGGFEVSRLGRIYGPYPMPDFHPAEIGFSMPADLWERERRRWTEWLSDSGDSLAWDAKELMFRKE